MWQFNQTPLKDAYLINMQASLDARGDFIKTFHGSTFLQNGIDFVLKESYFSHSKTDVIRGMHFQLPPHDHSKIVFCPEGAILDVIVDLRKDSATYGQYYAHELSSVNHLAYYIPHGFAHGFKALADNSITYYLVSSEYSKDHDTGILYNSFGFDWGVGKPIISARDLSFPALVDFKSPF
jgi:dTDP-4-dehydrorhamnose 3,5-epimerase